MGSLQPKGPPVAQPPSFQDNSEGSSSSDESFQRPNESLNESFAKIAENARKRLIQSEDEDDDCKLPARPRAAKRLTAPSSPPERAVANRSLSDRRRNNEVEETTGNSFETPKRTTIKRLSSFDSPVSAAEPSSAATTRSKVVTPKVTPAREAAVAYTNTRQTPQRLANAKATPELFGLEKFAKQKFQEGLGVSSFAADSRLCVSSDLLSRIVDGWKQMDHHRRAAYERQACSAYDEWLEGQKTKQSDFRLSPIVMKVFERDSTKTKNVFCNPDRLSQEYQNLIQAELLYRAKCLGVKKVGWERCVETFEELTQAVISSPPGREQFKIQVLQFPKFWNEFKNDCERALLERLHDESGVEKLMKDAWTHVSNSLRVKGGNRYFFRYAKSLPADTMDANIITDLLQQGSLEPSVSESTNELGSPSQPKRKKTGIDGPSGTKKLKCSKLHVGSESSPIELDFEKNDISSEPNSTEADTIARSEDGECTSVPPVPPTNEETSISETFHSPSASAALPDQPTTQAFPSHQIGHDVKRRGENGTTAKPAGPPSDASHKSTKSQTDGAADEHTVPPPDTSHKDAEEGPTRRVVVGEQIMPPPDASDDGLQTKSLEANVHIKEPPVPPPDALQEAAESSMRDVSTEKQPPFPQQDIPLSVEVPSSTPATFGSPRAENRGETLDEFKLRLDKSLLMERHKKEMELMSECHKRDIEAVEDEKRCSRLLQRKRARDNNVPQEEIDTSLPLIPAAEAP